MLNDRDIAVLNRIADAMEKLVPLVPLIHMLAKSHEKIAETGQVIQFPGKDKK